MSINIYQYGIQDGSCVREVKMDTDMDFKSEVE